MKKSLSKVMMAGLFAAVVVSGVSAAPKTKMSKEEKALYKQLDKKWGKEPEFKDPPKS